MSSPRFPIRFNCVRSIALILLVATGIFPGSVPVIAQNIDLAAAPPREDTQLTIYNAVDLTLVREQRMVSFSPGMNTLEFSWANTLIDPGSVRIAFVEHPDQLTIIDTVYPHARPQELNWHIESDLNGEALVEISYFTSGISWSADYVVIASEDEATAAIESYVTVTNQSGEDYDDAQIRLVVGKIHLVEAIAQLAQNFSTRGVRFSDVGRRQAGQMFDGELNERYDAEEQYLLNQSGFGGGAFDDSGIAPPEVIKEGLSEYFIFTVSGRHRAPHGWSRRILSVATDAAPLRVQYRYRPREYGDQLVKVYSINNDSTAGLGQSPLPGGMVRSFRRQSRPDAQGALSFLAAETRPYIAITDTMELNLGVDPNVVFELTAESLVRDEIWMRQRERGIRRIVLPNDDLVEVEPDLEVDDRSTVVGWQDTTHYVQRIRNQTGREIEVQVRRRIDGDATWICSTPTRSHDVHTAEYTVNVSSGNEASVGYRVARRFGHNQQQNRLLIEQPPPAAEAIGQRSNLPPASRPTVISTGITAVAVSLIGAGYWLRKVW